VSEADSTGQSTAAGGDAGRQPSEEELRAAYEAEMSRITSADMVLQAAVSLLNIGGYRLGLAPPPDEPAAGAGPDAGAQARDLEQVRDAIDAVRGLLPILERRRPGELRPLRDALSQLQMAYAREAGVAERGEDVTRTQSQAPSQPQSPSPSEPQSPSQPGPAQSSGRLWVPGR
jgi:hypothetical protein